MTDVQRLPIETHFYPPPLTDIDRIPQRNDVDKVAYTLVNTIWAGGQISYENDIIYTTPLGDFTFKVLVHCNPTKPSTPSAQHSDDISTYIDFDAGSPLPESGEGEFREQAPTDSVSL